MAAGWPATVPLYAMTGLKIKPEVNRVDFKTEVGPAKRRRRSSVATVLLTFATRMTISQYADLDDFYTIDLKDGTMSFMRQDPRDVTGPTIEFEFAGDGPEFTHVDGDFGDVSLALRRLP